MASNPPLDARRIAAEAPLFSALQAQSRTALLRCHMPGNLAGQAYPEPYDQGFVQLETTEVAGGLDLFEPVGAVSEAAERLAKLTGAAAVHLMTQGSTTAIFAALATALPAGGQLYLPRNVHISVLRAAAILDLDCHFLPLVTEPSGLLASLDWSQTAALLSELESPVVFVCAPDYYGQSLKISRLAELVHARGGCLIVDEAHGTHLCLDTPYTPPSALSQGADLVCNSWHKTMPALAPAAVLQLSARAVHELDLKARAERAVQLFHSTSPSYAIAASLDWARAYAELYGRQKLSQIAEAISAWRDSGGPEDALLRPRLETDVPDDPLHLLLSLPPAPIAFWQRRCEEVGLVPEIIACDHLLCLLSLATAPETVQAIQEKYALLRDQSVEGLPTAELEALHSALDWAYQLSAERIMSPREVLFGQGRALQRPRSVPIADCAGEIAADLIAPYPPGIALLWPGERISKRHVQLLEKLDALGIHCTGIAEGRLNIV